MKSAIERCKQCGRVICDCGLIERWNDECQQAPAAVIEGVKYLCLNEDALQRISAALSSATQAVRESVAKAIYEQWVDKAGYVPWVEGGNSLKQDDARDIARAALDASPVPLPDTGAQEVPSAFKTVPTGSTS